MLKLVGGQQQINKAGSQSDANIRCAWTGRDGDHWDLESENTQEEAEDFLESNDGSEAGHRRSTAREVLQELFFAGKDQ